MNRRYLTIALLPCMGLSLALILAPTVEAKCRYPTLVTSSTKAERGSTLTVKGESFWLRCIDEGRLPLPRMEPAKKIRVLFKQGDQSTVLATVDADADLRFSVTITIPAQATIGNATFTAEADSYRRFTPTAFGDIETIQPVAFEIVESGQR